jgi:imidazolonepropionase-like amidohydrolase
LALFLLGHRVGVEEYTQTADALAAHFEYLDRATKVALDASLTFKPDFTPRSFESHGRTYRLFPVDVSIPDASGRRPSFTLEGMAPISAQALLIRYWVAHGRPDTMSIEPSHDVVRIVERGKDENVNGTPPGLRHFTIDGVVWGREDVWLDAQDMSVAIALTTAGVMAFEAYAPKYEALAPSWRRMHQPAQFAQFQREQREVQPKVSDDFALVGGRIVDATGGPIIERGTIVVRAGRIDRLGAQDTVVVPRGMTTIDVTGRTVLPGLWDMHAHVGQPEWGPVYLASGVTTARDMGGEFDVVTGLRDAWGRTLLGPRLLLAGLVDGPGPGSFGHVTAADPAEGVAVVRKYKAAGFQQMKLYSLLDRATVTAIVEAAHARGMTVTGHIPNGLTLREAIEIGMDNVAHLAVRGMPGSEEQKQTIAFLKERGTVIDPTVSWNELLGRTAQTHIGTLIPRIQHVSGPLSRMLAAANGGSVTAVQARDRLDRSLQTIKALHDAGVPIVAGTDKGVPGVSLAREIELYVEAGLSPIEAIRAATAVPAKVMGLAADSGTLAPGLRADLIVVEGNPLRRIADIENVTLVSADGRLYDVAPLWKAGAFRE